MPHETGESGNLNLRYPVYAVVSPEPHDEESLIVVELEGKECLPLFRTRELGELYVEQVQNAGSESSLILHECNNDNELEHLLVQLPSSVADVIWDATLQPQALRVTAVQDLLEVIRGDGGPP